MQYGICHLSIVPLRNLASGESTMISQVLYGEHFKVLERRAHFSKIRNSYDNFEAWIDNKQYKLIEEVDYAQLDNQSLQLSSDLIEFIIDEKGLLMPIVLGSSISYCQGFGHQFDGEYNDATGRTKGDLIATASLFLNTPHTLGGRTPFGIDAAGFAQAVYRINGYQLSRQAASQAMQGEALSFIEESEPGDLAFFDDLEGTINHVGIMMQDNYIIHVDGKVRIDRIDHT